MVKYLTHINYMLLSLILILFVFGPSTIFAQSTIANFGSLEGDLPSYWSKGSEPSGATVEWATDQAFVLGRSLKISKTATAEEAYWLSENMCDMWTPKLNANENITIGGFVKTEGINTNPATDDAKWFISYTFNNASGGLIGERIIEIDQTQASSDWTELPDSLVLPEEAYEVLIKIAGGKDATGTVWVDALKWPAIWNRTNEFPTGWYNWLPWTDNSPSHGYENTRLTSDEAHTGMNSLMFDLPLGRTSHDAFVGAKRVLLDNDVKEGDVLRLSVWIKATQVYPDSAAKYGDSWTVGFTPIFFTGVGNNDGFGTIGAVDAHFQFPNATSFNWTKYTMDVAVPGEGARAVEVRLHPYSTFCGTIYFDDLEIEVLDINVGVDDEDNNELPKTYVLDQNYPNPFNPTTTIGYSLPNTGEVTLEIFNVLGRHIRTLVNETQSAGHHNIMWDAKDKSGNSVVSGVYIYRLRALNTGNVNISLIKKMIILK